MEHKNHLELFDDMGDSIADNSHQTIAQTVKYTIPIDNNACQMVCEYTPRSHLVDLRTVRFDAPPGTDNLLTYTQTVFANIRNVAVPDEDIRIRATVKAVDGSSVLCEVRHKKTVKKNVKKKQKRDVHDDESTTSDEQQDL